VPLVLHGSTGLSEEDLKKCVALGVCKVNFATELRAVFTAAVRAALEDGVHTHDPKSYLSAGREAVHKRVCERIETLGSAGKAEGVVWA